ncbi:MAG: zf-HC2 domain-containing protein [Rubrivivax sp.]|nr:zf-HC2 domain-containing protein [Rubrivivax sp.]MDP3614376.1 zf-HC2 domain-containing protein [Rubrivivax sp.]
MNDRTQAGCPRTEAISSLIDGELGASAAQELRLHAAHCVPCGSALLAFNGLRADLQALREIRSDVDIAALVLPQLPRPAAFGREQARPRGGLWHIGPRALGGAAALGVGAYLGLMLVAGGGVALRPASMSVFSGEPPGAFCAGLPSCSARGR